MAHSDLKVIGIVSRCDFQSTGAKRHVHIAVFDNRNFSVHQREHYRLGFEIPVAVVIRMHCNCRISQHGFRPRGGHHDGTAVTGIRITDMIQMPVSLFMFDFKVGQCGVASMTPVDDVIAAINQVLLVKINKHLAHGQG